MIGVTLDDLIGVENIFQQINKLSSFFIKNIFQTSIPTGRSRKAVLDAAGVIPPKKFLQIPKTHRILIPYTLLCSLKQTFLHKSRLVFALLKKNFFVDFGRSGGGGAFAPNAPRPSGSVTVYPHSPTINIRT